MIEVRLATKKDIDDLAKIQVESWNNAFKNIIVDEELKKYANFENRKTTIENVFSTDKNHYYIAFFDNKPCGQIYWCIDETLENTAEINGVHTLPETWGSGVGKEMLKKVLEDIKKEKIDVVYLWTFVENKRARRFYEKAGFKEENKNQVRFGDSLEVRYLTKL